MWQALIKLVEKWACGHEWVLQCEHERIRLFIPSGEKHIDHYLYIYKCTKCGKFKKITSK